MARRVERLAGLLAMPGHRLVGEGRNRSRPDEVDDAPVDLLPLRFQQAVIGRLLDEDVAEPDGCAGRFAAQDAGLDEAVDRFVEADGEAAPAP